MSIQVINIQKSLDNANSEIAKVKGEHIVTVKLLKSELDEVIKYSKSLSSMVQDTSSLLTKLTQIRDEQGVMRNIDRYIQREKNYLLRNRAEQRITI